jgi:nitrogen fixation NifU-like protein
MSELSELYQQVILDHNKKPRNFASSKRLITALKAFNPLCGDQLTIYLNLEDDTVKEVGFEGSGCAISKAAAKHDDAGRQRERAKNRPENLFQEFHSMVTGQLNEETEENSLGNLKIFAGVREFPVRVKCATLPGTPSTPPSIKKHKSLQNNSLRYLCVLCASAVTRFSFLSPQGRRDNAELNYTDQKEIQCETSSSNVTLV